MLLTQRILCVLCDPRFVHFAVKLKIMSTLVSHFMDKKNRGGGNFPPPKKFKVFSAASQCLYREGIIYACNNSKKSKGNCNNPGNYRNILKNQGTF